MDKIEVCKKCTNQKFDRDQGIVCGLTGQKPTFEKSCPDYNPTEAALFKEQTKAPIKPNQQRAKTAVLLIWCLMALDVICIISSYFQYELLTVANNGGFISDAEAEANDNREMIIGLIYFVFSIISIVTFIQWFRRAYYNFNSRNSNSAYSDGWAAGAWFVPIISLYRPYQIMKEMWVGTSKIITTTSDTIVKNNSTAIIGLWWTLWIVTNYVANYVVKASFKSDSIGEYLNATMGDMVSSFLSIPLGYVTILMIQRYAKKEEQLVALENN